MTEKGLLDENYETYRRNISVRELIFLVNFYIGSTITTLIEKSDRDGTNEHFEGQKYEYSLFCDEKISRSPGDLGCCYQFRNP